MSSTHNSIAPFFPSERANAGNADIMEKVRDIPKEDIEDAAKLHKGRDYSFLIINHGKPS